jgi:hypothetical protein
MKVPRRRYYAGHVDGGFDKAALDGSQNTVPMVTDESVGHVSRAHAYLFGEAAK